MPGEHPIFVIPLTPNPSPTRGEGRILYFSPLSRPWERGGTGGEGDNLCKNGMLPVTSADFPPSR